MALTDAETKLAEALWSRYRRGADDVLVEVARLFHVDAGEITGKSQKAVLTDARSVVALILRNRAYTTTEIGLIINRDHSHVSYLCRRIKADPELRVLAEGLAA